MPYTLAKSMFEIPWSVVIFDLIRGRITTYLRATLSAHPHRSVYGHFIQHIIPPLVALSHKASVTLTNQSVSKQFDDLNQSVSPSDRMHYELMMSELCRVEALLTFPMEPGDLQSQAARLEQLRLKDPALPPEFETAIGR